MLWGYGHYFIFAVGRGGGRRAGGGGRLRHPPRGDLRLTAGYAVAVPVAVYLFFVWLLHIRPHQAGPLVVAYPAVAVLTLLAPLGPAPIHSIAVLLAAGGDHGGAGPPGAGPDRLSAERGQACVEPERSIRTHSAVPPPTRPPHSLKTPTVTASE